ncbi:MAG: class I SAM-dependent methyltransferase [Candidatus Gastranaerophilales bacterium]|nr:class I SAM-dependent methyltransferase [Candidatus Gastranaerophilales bacterium]
MNYTANDNLEVMKVAKNYNGFLIKNIYKLIKKYNLKKVLDFGCSDGFFIEQLSLLDKNLHFCGIEKDKTSIEACLNKKIEIYDDLSKTNCQFDLIYSLNVLEHIENDCEILAQFREKLSDNGKIFLYVPSLQFLFSSMDKKTGHFRRYEKKELINKVKTAGFKIEKVEFCDSIGVLATLLYIFKDKLKSNNGDINKNQIKIYDLIFPLSRLFDLVFFSKFIGKNLLLIASKI